MQRELSSDRSGVAGTLFHARARGFKERLKSSFRDGGRLFEERYFFGALGDA